MQEPSLEDLRSGAIAVFQTTAQSSQAPHKKGLTYAILSATAGLGKLCLKYGQALFRNNFSHLADNDALVMIAREYGIFLRQALPARISVKISATGVLRLPAGSLIQHKFGQFITTEVSEFIDGIAIATAIATTSAQNLHIKIGDSLTLQQLLAADQQALVHLVDYVGQDAETYEQLRTRLLRIIRNQGPAGSQPYYIRNTLLLDGVDEAYVYRGAPVAQVSIYPIMSGRRLPNSNEIQDISSKIGSPEVSFVGDFVQVLPMNMVQVRVAIRNLSSTAQSTRDRITAGIKEYIEARRPVQHTLEKDALWFVSLLDLYAIVSNVGSKSANIELFVNTTKTEMYALKSPAVDGYNIPPELAHLQEVVYD